MSDNNMKEDELTRRRYEAINRTPETWGVWDWKLSTWAVNGFGDTYSTRNHRDALDVALMANYWEGRS
jgi:hypothetical protein